MGTARAALLQRARRSFAEGSHDESLLWLEVATGANEPPFRESWDDPDTRGRLGTEPSFTHARLATAGWGPAVESLNEIHPRLGAIHGEPNERRRSESLLDFVQVASSVALKHAADELPEADPTVRRAALLIVLERLAVLERQWRRDSHSWFWDTHEILKGIATSLLRRSNDWAPEHLHSYLGQLARTRYCHMMPFGWLLGLVETHCDVRAETSPAHVLMTLAYARSKAGPCSELAVERRFHDRVHEVFGGPIPPSVLPPEGLDPQPKDLSLQTEAPQPLEQPTRTDAEMQLHPDSPDLQRQFERVVSDPHDEEALRKYADLLSAAGEPRGELIALQAIEEPTAKQERRFKAIVKKHGDDFAGPIADADSSHKYTFENGFVTECLIEELDVESFATSAHHPVWKMVRRLTIHGLEEFTPLGKLSNLEDLLVYSSSSGDISPLADLHRLERLVLYGAKYGDLTPLRGLNRLREIKIAGWQITDISPLANLTSLEILSLGPGQVENLAPLSGLANLQHLSLRQTRITDLTPLADLRSLRVLDVSLTKVADLRPLGNLSELEELNVYATNVTDNEIDRLQELLPRLDFYT